MSVRDDTLDPSKLTRTEFAVVRAYAQGMAAVDIANRYLLDPDEEEALTEHQAVQRILRLRDRLVQFALQNNRPDIAAMFDSLKGRSNVAMDRRVDALSSLERLSPGRPALDHAVSLWFGPSLSRRLAAGGIERIGDLVERVNRRGAAWWRAVPRLGAKSADVVRHWLERQRDTLRASDGRPVLGPQVGALVVPSQRPPMTLAPLDDRLEVPVPLEYMLCTALYGDWRAVLGEELQLVRQWLESKRPGSPYLGQLSARGRTAAAVGGTAAAALAQHDGGRPVGVLGFPGRSATRGVLAGSGRAARPDAVAAVRGRIAGQLSPGGHARDTGAVRLAAEAWRAGAPSLRWLCDTGWGGGIARRSARRQGGRRARGSDSRSGRWSGWAGRSPGNGSRAGGRRGYECGRVSPLARWIERHADMADRQCRSLSDRRLRDANR
ncbi:hypothetical protein OJJOAM_003648 [Cupriavidus sp. H18C1]|uniref:phage integrase family protein n=1 Tax=Cupriavidus sp. H18C1 TaxID=3241601 RepID=UPI003BB87523